MAAFIDEDMNNPQINSLVFIASIANVEWPFVIPNFFCKCWKTFGKYWWIEILMLWTSFFVFTSRTSFLVLVELEGSSMPSCFQESASCVFSCRLTWENSIGCRLGFRISFLMLGPPPCSFSTFPDWRSCSNLADGSSSHSTGCTTPDSWVSTSPSPNSLALVLPSVNLHWKSLLVLSWTRHSVTWSDQKENYWNGCKREHRQIHDVEKTKKMIPLITGETLFGQHISELVFGVNIFDLDLWFFNWFCRTTNQAQLCGFWTRVSLLDFVLWWSSWSQLRYLERCATETGLEKNV